MAWIPLVVTFTITIWLCITQTLDLRLFALMAYPTLTHIYRHTNERLHLCKLSREWTPGQQQRKSRKHREAGKNGEREFWWRESTATAQLLHSYCTMLTRTCKQHTMASLQLWPSVIVSQISEFSISISALAKKCLRTPSEFMLGWLWTTQLKQTLQEHPHQNNINLINSVTSCRALFPCEFLW